MTRLLPSAAAIARRRRFYGLWLAKSFHKPSWAETVGSVASLGLAAAGQLWPHAPLMAYAWQAPFWGVGLLAIVRLVAAPYEIWRDQQQQIASLGAGDTREERFHAAIMDLRYLASAKELWWTEHHRKDGNMVMRDRLNHAIDAIRQFFPPELHSSFDDDPVYALHRATNDLTRGLGYGWGGDRLGKVRLSFEEELNRTILRFEGRRL